MVWQPDPGSASFRFRCVPDAIVILAKESGPLVSPVQMSSSLSVCRSVCYILCMLHLRVTKVLPHFGVWLSVYLAGMWVTLWAISTHGPTTGAENLDWPQSSSGCSIYLLFIFLCHNHDQAMTNSVVLLQFCRLRVVPKLAVEPLQPACDSDYSVGQLRSFNGDQRKLQVDKSHRLIQQSFSSLICIYVYVRRSAVRT